MLTIDEQLDQALAKVKSLEADAQASANLLSEAAENSIRLTAQVSELQVHRTRLDTELATARLTVEALTGEKDVLASQATELQAQRERLDADLLIDVVPVQLNRHKYKTVHVTAREAAETALNVLETLVASAVKQLAQDVLQDVFSEITNANYGAPAIAALASTAFDYKKVLGVRETCAAAKMPVSDRALVLDGAYFTNLLGDDIVAKSFMPPIAQPGVVEGVIRRLAGFDVYETSILPENGEKLVGFAAHPSCLAVAMRYLMPVADYDEAGAVTDPDTGLTFGYLRYTETSSNRIFVTVECLYGFKKAIGNGLKRIVKP